MAKKSKKNKKKEYRKIKFVIRHMDSMVVQIIDVKTLLSIHEFGPFYPGAGDVITIRGDFFIKNERT